MRIADKMALDQVNTGLSKNRSELADLQNQAATQKRITKPSDDPLATTRVLQARTEISGGKQFLKSINQAKSFLEYSEQSLGELSEALMRAKELAISQSNDASASRQTRETTATEINQILSQTVQVANRKLGDRFLFGGYRTTRAPFSPEGQYRGDTGEMKIAINKDAVIAMNIPGNRVFLGDSIHSPASAGPKPSVDGGAGGKEAKPLDPWEKPLASGKDSDGRKPASIAPGAELKRFEVEESQQSDDPEAPVKGADTWKTQGVNVFSVLKDLEAGLRTNDKQAVQGSLERIDDAIGQIVIARSELGARVNAINNTSETLQKAQVDTKGLASSLEDADTFELVTDMNKTEGTLKASLETSGKLIQPSLLDFLK